MTMAEPSVTERRHKTIDCPISRARVFDCFHDGTRVVAEVSCSKCPTKHRIPVSAGWNVASVSDRLRGHDWIVDSEGRNALCPSCKKPKRERGEIPIGKPSAPPPPANPPPRRSEPLTSKPLAGLDALVTVPDRPVPPPPANPPRTIDEAVLDEHAGPDVYMTDRASRMAPHLQPRVCARPGCGVTFKPDRVSQLYHSHQCSRQFHLERRRKTDMPPTTTTTTSSTAKADTPQAIRAERLMYQLLDDHYDGETHRFDEGWSDDKVAKESGVALLRVCKCREALYGRPVSVELLKLQSEIAAAIEKAKTDKATIDGMIRTTYKDLQTLVKESFDRDMVTLKELAARVAREIGSDS